uniref:Uncharacterized protein n=1 Tax=Rhizophora mucronata TaxID=61149 RepID=A0A2P2NXC3_RHIMU
MNKKKNHHFFHNILQTPLRSSASHYLKTCSFNDNSKQMQLYHSPSNSPNLHTIEQIIQLATIYLENSH